MTATLFRRRIAKISKSLLRSGCDWRYQKIFLESSNSKICYRKNGTFAVKQVAMDYFLQVRSFDTLKNLHEVIERLLGRHAVYNITKIAIITRHNIKWMHDVVYKRRTMIKDANNILMFVSLKKIYFVLEPTTFVLR